jgi:V/A-type H+-transporting ATPase subunit I
MAIFFPFMFGFCLTDAFYGLIFTIAGVIMVLGMGKINESFDALGWISIHCGIWGVFLGSISNGVLGDFFPKFFPGLVESIPRLVPNFTPVYNAAGQITLNPFALVDAFAIPQYVLILAIAVGIIHVNIATIIGVIDKIRYGKIKEAIGENIVWLVLQVAVVFLGLGFMIPSIGMIGMAIGGVGFLAVFGILIYAKGAFGVMDIFSFLGNILSYARLLALCLSTAGIAMTVNILADMCQTMIPEMLGIPVFIGLILMVIVLIFGHIANFLIQIIGGFINTMRFHFVEFFTHFYM